MPGLRIEDILEAAELDDSPENRSLIQQIAKEEGVDFAPEFDTSIATMQTPGAPVQPMKVPRPGQLLGDKSYGVTGEIPDFAPLPPPVTGPQEALGRAGMRFGVGAAEGIAKPFLQVAGEMSEKIAHDFPGGDIGLDEFMSKAGLLAEATVGERFAQKTGEVAGFFAPISGVGRAVRAGQLVPKALNFLVEPTLIGMASVMDARSQRGDAGEPLTAEDWKTFGHSIALLPAGALAGAAVTESVSALMQKPLAEGMRRLIGNATVGAAFGAYTGHQGKLEREEFIEEVLASGLGFVIGGQVAHSFSGDLRPNTAGQAKASVEAVTDAVSAYAERPKSKFEALVEEQSAIESYGIRKQMAENFWTNTAAKEGERPTFEQVKGIFRLTDADARKIVTTKVSGAEIAEVKENQKIQAELEAAHAQGPEALQAKLIELGLMPEGERKVFEARSQAAMEPGTMPGENFRDTMVRPEGTSPLFDASGRIIPPAKQATQTRVGPGVDVASTEATARLEQVRPLTQGPPGRAIEPVERVGQPRGVQPAPEPAPLPAPKQYPIVRVGSEPVLPPQTVRVPEKPGPSSYPTETPESEILRQRQGLRRRPKEKPAPKVRVTRKSTTQPAGRQEVAPGKIPPPGKAPAAPEPLPPIEEMTGAQAAQRLREIRDKLGVRGLPPEERAALHQERTKILGSELPFDSDFSKQASVGAAMGQKPRPKSSPTQVEAERTIADPKATPKEKEVARATTNGGKEAEKSAAIIEASKPAAARSSDVKLNVGIDPTVAYEWMKTAKARLPKVNPPEYEALNKGKPGPREIERMVGEIEDLFHGRPESFKERSKQAKALVEKFKGEFPEAAQSPASKAAVDAFTGRYILPAIDFVMQQGPAGERIGQGMLRTWRRVLTRENEILFDLGEKQMEWGAYKRGRVKNWLKELNDNQRDQLHDWTDAYAMGKRGKELPRLVDDDVRLMAAAWEKSHYGERTVQLSDAEGKIVDGFVGWQRPTYGWFLGESIATGNPTKTYVASQPGAQYLPIKLDTRTFQPIEQTNWTTGKTAWVKTDQGVMTKAEFAKRVNRARELQDAIVKEMLEKKDDSGKPLHTEMEVRQRLREYRDKYFDPYAQEIVDRFQQGVNEPETNLTLHRYFDVRAGTEADLSRLLKQYMRSNLLAIEMSREWGAQRESARAMIEVAGLQGHQKKPLAEAFDIAMMQDPKANRQSGKIMSEIRGWAMFSKLGKTVLLQIPQDVMISAYTPFQTYASGIPKTLRGRIYTDPNLPIAIRQRLGDRLSAKYIAKTGALVESELHTAIEQLHGWGPKAATFMLAKTGMRMLDQFNRGHAGISGSIYGEKVLHDYRYATSAKAKALAEAKIREGLQDPKDVKSALSGEWVRDAKELERLTAMFGEAVAYRSQFRTLPIDMPLARSDGAFRAVYDLKGYSIRASREMFRVFNLRNPTSPLRNRTTALRWLAGIAASGVVSGWFVQRLREALLGEDPEDDPWWVNTRDALVSVGFFPIFFDLWNTAKGAYGDKNPATILIGPYSEYAGEQVKAGAQAISERSTKPLYRQAARNVPKTPYERVIEPTIRRPLAERGMEQQGGGRRRRVRVRVRRRRAE